MITEGLDRLRREPPSETAALVGLAGLSALGLVGALALGLGWFPLGFQALPLLGGGLLLRPAALYRLAGLVGVCVVVLAVVAGLAVARPGALVVLAATALVMREVSRSREQTGLSGLRGDSVLAELRRRLEQQGQLPPLPDPWRAQAVVRPAGGGPFAGDFVVSARTSPSRLEVALVDVSGKGVAAGTRALLLSGAMGGLLGAHSPSHLLPAANDYLDRQCWEEGFATAVHLVLHLDTGEFAVESAGHPPAAQFHAGSGRWSLLQAAGPALGLLPHVTYDGARGRLDPGDALLLYTDGLVELPGRDLEVGIDKLIGEAERLVPHGFAGGVEQLLDRVAARGDDDRGLVLIWRNR